VVSPVGLSDLHQRHLANLCEQRVSIDDEGLRIGDQYVMFFAEAGLMCQHVERLTAGMRRPDVLEVGLGLGVFASQLNGIEVGSYTAVEPHHAVARLAAQRVLNRMDAPVTVHAEPWQLLALPDRTFDVIMYDTWPPDGQADADFAIFVEHVAVRCLRPGGRFSFFHSGTTINAARRRVLDRNFAVWTSHPHTMPANEQPRHWTKPTRDFLIPIAVKEEH
jgi:spermidine synthase